ncbi:16S rRNA (cytidine(1402)-2'-O)-methyltransferase [Gracilibacillus caseinilyticus]|uniref:Ribosomal RNA small subunit methyltransferase I n=1 Tax=Gracilibacillus caseinilyticus TaxID=2932256 RepID=A0ABY4EYR5_9BACI|nr:16S rRNA (cytidine(1402)-2'-O)-methyltransferase [Gracilibacillus caseinilyticus]UOQ49536.1 16S rRNA (cytidine(1402)-2'-O)-methyltransferase [Gracilibacillus caseinilyticus]
MQIQKSYQNESEKGTLYVVPTPIGNLDDITFRALKVLEQADIVLAEDTRNTGKLLHHFELKKKMISYHEHNKMAREDQIIDMLQKGKMLALVSDAGMPGISDPGYEIIRAAIDADYSVVVLPGASAALSALVGSGLPTDQFYFYGFLPRKKKDRDQALQLLQSIDTTFILYESPHRIVDTLQLLADSLGDRRVAVARELTKKFEEFIRGNLAEVSNWITDNPVKGECVILVEGVKLEDQVDWWEDLTLSKHVEQLIEREQVSSKEAIKSVAKARNIPKREVYSAYHME